MSNQQTNAFHTVQSMKSRKCQQVFTKVAARAYVIAHFLESNTSFHRDNVFHHLLHDNAHFWTVSQLERQYFIAPKNKTFPTHHVINIAFGTLYRPSSLAPRHSYALVRY